MSLQAGAEHDLGEIRILRARADHTADRLRHSCRGRLSRTRRRHRPTLQNLSRDRRDEQPAVGSLEQQCAEHHDENERKFDARRRRRLDADRDPPTGGRWSMNKRVGRLELRPCPDPTFDPVQKSLTEAYCKGQQQDAKHRDKNSSLTNLPGLRIDHFRRRADIMRLQRGCGGMAMAAGRIRPTPASGGFFCRTRYNRALSIRRSISVPRQDDVPLQHLKLCVRRTWSAARDSCGASTLRNTAH